MPKIQPAMGDLRKQVEEIAEGLRPHWPEVFADPVAALAEVALESMAHGGERALACAALLALLPPEEK